MRSWRVVAMAEFPGFADSRRWDVVARRWTRWGAERTARRYARRGVPNAVPMLIRYLGTGYCHRDEMDRLPTIVGHLAPEEA